MAGTYDGRNTMSIKTTAIQGYNAVAAAVVTPNPWAGKAFGIDVSRYQDKLLLKPYDVDFVIAKVGGSEAGVFNDGRFAYHVQSAYDAGAACMGYWYVDSSYYNPEITIGGIAKQSNDKHPILQTIIRGLRSGNTAWKYCQALFFDLETKGNGSAWNREYIEDLRNRIADLKKTGDFPQIKTGIYSSRNVMATEPEMSVWCEQRPEQIIWTANYLTAFPGMHAPLATIRKERLPLTTQKAWWFGDNPARPKENGRFWQYHGTFGAGQPVTCPEVLNDQGKPSGLDLNVYEGTRADLFKMLGIKDPLITPPPPPPPVDPPPTTDLAARVERLEAFMAAVKGA